MGNDPSELAVSSFVRPGWFLASCEDRTCATDGPGRYGAFRDRDERDRWAAEHQATAGHRVFRLDGHEGRPE